MNAISVYRRRLAENDAVAIYDVGGCIRSWGRRGILSGGVFGFVLGGIFEAFPFAAGVLTFGISGTLMICALECAAVAGGFSVLIAALNGHGVLRDNTTGLDRALAMGRLSAGANWREDDAPLFDGCRPFYQPYKLIPPAISHCRDTVSPSLQHTQTRLSAIQSWENEGGALAHAPSGRAASE